MRATSGAMFAKSMKENKTLKCVKLEKNSININFLEQIDAYIERNNVHMMDNNVVELRQNRSGYLNTRIAAWNEVHRLRQIYRKDTINLKKSLDEKIEEQNRLQRNLDNQL